MWQEKNHRDTSRSSRLQSGGDELGYRKPTVRVSFLCSFLGSVLVELVRIKILQRENRIGKDQTHDCGSNYTKIEQAKRNIHTELPKALWNIWACIHEMHTVGIGGASHESYPHHRNQEDQKPLISHAPNVLSYHLNSTNHSVMFTACKAHKIQTFLILMQLTDTREMVTPML